MKKTFILSAILLFSLNGISQNFGILAGVNAANQRFEVNDEDTESNDGLLGFRVGPVAEFQLGESLFAKTGLIFDTKGSTDSDNDDLKFKVYYVEVPAHIAYKKPASNALELFAETGPDIGIGVLAQAVLDGDSEDIEFGDQFGELSRLHIGWSIGGGLDYGRFQAALKYQFGITDVQGDDDDDSSTKNSVFSVNFSWFFNRDVASGPVN